MWDLGTWRVQVHWNGGSGDMGYRDTKMWGHGDTEGTGTWGHRDLKHGDTGMWDMGTWEVQGQWDVGHGDKEMAPGNGITSFQLPPAPGRMREGKMVNI